MLTKIDWISFTVRRVVEEGDTERSALGQGWDALEELWEDCYNALNVTHDWTWQKGRKPYAASYRSPDNGVAIFVHPRLDHILFEISGRGCDTLAKYEHAEAFLESIAGRLTRLDVAVDMHTDTSPTDFLAEREMKRFKSSGIQTSESGITCYIGSRTSNRYACVYRYNPPHERSHLLRSEFRMKAEDAEYCARAILAEGLPAVAKTLGDQFGWRHPDWQPDAEDAAILRVWRPERGAGKTLFWLADTIAPLLVKLHNEGSINLHSWLAENVLPSLHHPDDGTFPI